MLKALCVRIRRTVWQISTVPMSSSRDRQMSSVQNVPRQKARKKSKMKKLHKEHNNYSKSFTQLKLLRTTKKIYEPQMHNNRGKLKTDYKESKIREGFHSMCQVYLSSTGKYLLFPFRAGGILSTTSSNICWHNFDLHLQWTKSCVNSNCIPRFCLYNMKNRGTVLWCICKSGH